MTSIELHAPTAAFSPEYDRQATPEQAPGWTLATRIAFRFSFVYFGLYVLTTQMLAGMTLVHLPIPNLGTVRPMSTVVAWVGAHVLGIARTVASHPSGSGDTLYDWTQALSLVLIAAVATAVWSYVARRRREHARLYAWFRLFARFALATTLVSYGAVKVVPLQMPTDVLRRLVEPFGNFSPMGVLWTSIGAAPAYEIFAGLAELCAATLLFIPRTALLGTMMALMDSIAIFALNMTYDVPVKLFAFHLILLSVFLLAPNLVRLRDFFLLKRATAARPESPLGSTPRRRRAWLIAQLVYGVLVLVLAGFSSATAYTRFGGGAPKSVLYGVWDIEEMAINGQPSLPLLSDTARFRRAIFQRPGSVIFQRMNDSFVGFGAIVDTAAHHIALTAFDSARTRSGLTFQRPSSDRLIVDGIIAGAPTHMELRRRDPGSYVLRSRGFHWVQEFPFNS
jgi:hypothetical protein